MEILDQALLVVKNVDKKYPSGFQLKNISFSLSPGQCIGFLGPNGAGKSTLFQMLTGNLDASKGEIFLKNKKLNPEAFLVKRQVGYLPQHLNLPQWVTGTEILNYAASLYQLKDGSEKIKEQMEYWDCKSYAHQAIAACSHGMQKRIGLALATIHEPVLLILDEPFSGLDLYHIRALKNEINRRKEKGLATILSSHIAPYVANLCQNIFLFKNGQISQISAWKDKSYLDKIDAIERSFS